MRACRGSKAALSYALVLASSGAAFVATAAPIDTARTITAGLAAAGPHLPSLLLPVQAQRVDVKVDDIEGPPGQPIPLNIKVMKAGGGDQLFILTGIPDGISINPGGNFGKFWAVNSKVMSALTLTAPEGYSGSFTVSLVRRREGGASTTAASFKVTIREGVTAATAATAATSEPAAPAQAAVAAAKPPAGPEPKPSLAPEPAKPARKSNPNEAAYMARAKTLLDSGDVSGARAIFETLALQGSAAGAMAMGETYDPVILRTMVVKGLEPDPEKARKWYLKAEALGGPDARSRLNELARR
jgi:hypothetical protein